ncbi:MAG: hypothetical protein HY905_10510 [Deltaproteobacteria bacterium]|nr:hypothetical protein [Deltaproteobacteria bacterium]
MKIGPPYSVSREALSFWRSRAFKRFLQDFFVDARGLSRREIPPTYLARLSPAELDLARVMVRRNLHLNYAHIVEACGTLGDSVAIPALSSMLRAEESLSRRLTISGALWRLRRDPSFVGNLEAMTRSEKATLKVAHIDQIPWLADARAIGMLIELLEDADRFVTVLARGELNDIEHGRRFAVEQPPSSAPSYLARRDDAPFLAAMARNLVQSYLPRRQDLGPFGLWTGEEARKAATRAPPTA